MKKAILTFSVMMMSFLLVIISCKKDDDDPVPSEKKKYAWATGIQDSTGYGMILFSSDAGENWVRQGQGTAALQGVDVVDIWAIDENNVWATGPGNALLRTTNGGKNWTTVPLPSNIPDASTNPICILNKTNIWVAGSNNTISMVYKSMDGGATWTMLDTAFFQKTFLQGIWAISNEIVYVAGGRRIEGSIELGGFIAFTVDGGTTWDSITLANDYNKWEWIGVVSSGNTIVVHGGKSRFVVSTDNGSTWKNDSVEGAGGVDGADINDLIMLDPLSWWGAFDLGNIMITNDGGMLWTKQPVPPGPAAGSFLVGIDNWDKQMALIVSSGFFYPPLSPILKTTDGGASWEEKYVCNTQLWKVTFIKD